MELVVNKEHNQLVLTMEEDQEKPVQVLDLEESRDKRR